MKYKAMINHVIQLKKEKPILYNLVKSGDLSYDMETGGILC